MTETLKYNPDDDKSGKVVGLRLAFIVTRMGTDKVKREGVIDTGLPLVKQDWTKKDEAGKVTASGSSLKFQSGTMLRQPIKIGGDTIRYIVAGWRTSFGWMKNATTSPEEGDFD